MCGISGLLSESIRSDDVLQQIVQGMANKIEHRGPDDSGLWTSSAEGIAFGHRRLSVVDLSPAGHQPMTSSSSRFVIAFNGEIYNHLELRKDLEESHISGRERIKWRGHSDTETLLAAFETWGIEDTLNKTIGMFAIALWDSKKSILYLIRDRFGEKPLYYGWVGSGEDRAFIFGSELKALCAFPGFDTQVCRQALGQYMRYAYVPAPRSIYKNIYKLEAGSILTINGSDCFGAPSRPLRPSESHGSLSLKRWWSLSDVVKNSERNKISNENDAINSLEKTLSDSVRLQSLADVPLGAFLSGGVDSSAIVALMQEQASRPIKTFTIGFEDSSYDESTYASAVSKHIGTDHTEMLVSETEVQSVIPLLPTMYDEPFADASQIPTYLVCNAARKHVTVALSGDAGDELFGGYNRYFWGPRIWAKLAWLPYPLRQALGSAIRALPKAGWDTISHPINFLIPGSSIVQAGDKAHKLAESLNGAHNLDDLYRNLISEWRDPAKVVRNDNDDFMIDSPGLLSDALPENIFSDEVDNPLSMMYKDSMTYLPDDILCKVDRAAMSTSLETRVPFLDHRLTELAWRLPLNMKIRDGKGKWILRQVLYKYVPKELVDRPKAGFTIPLGQWLRGPLRPWAESLLDENRLQEEGYFYPTPVRKKWDEHLKGQHDHTSSLWTVLIFQDWLSSTKRTN